MPRLVPLVLLALLAGCTVPAPAPGIPDATEADARALSFQLPVVAIPACSDSCAEASVASDLLGRLYASTQRGESLVRSDDGGAAWIDLAPPPVAPGAPPSVPTEPLEQTVDGVNFRIVNRADTLVQTDPAGRLFWTSIVGAAQGIQVARSDDGGATWASNVWVSLANDPSIPPGATDRQWLAFSRDGAVYLTYFQIPTGLWIARSDDGGATFGGWTRFVPTEERQTLGYESVPLVLPSGRVLVAYLSGPPIFTQPQRTPSAVRLAISDDRGATWRSVDVHAPDEESASDVSPMLARLADGRVAASWRAPASGELLVALSEDEGESWGAPGAWAEGVSGEIGPALVATPRGLLSAWHTDAHGLVATRTPGDAAAVADVGWVDSDFVFVAGMPDGRVAATFAREGRVFVAVESP